MVRAAGCRAEGESFYGDVRVRDVRPRLAGPLRGTSLSCAQGSVTAAAPQIALDLSLSDDRNIRQGTADAARRRPAEGRPKAQRVGVLGRCAGRAERTENRQTAAAERE